MINLLVRFRFVGLAATVGLLAFLVLLDRRVTYEQSLTSFFAAGDPDVLSYQKASAAFGNDNFVFVTYDDPELLTAAGMDRLRELVASLGPGAIDAVVDVQSLDRMPLFWQVDQRLADLARLPALARNLAVRTLQGSIATISRADSPFTIGGALRGASGKSLDELRSQITRHPLLRGTLVDPGGTATAVVVRLTAMADQDPKATIAALREAADAFATRHGLRRPFLAGPPVLLADGFSAIEEDGRRLALVGMGLIGLVMLAVTRSLWWSIVPILAGWTVWRLAETAMSLLGLKLALSGGPLVAQIIVLTLPAASHLAIHFREALHQSTDRRQAAAETLRSVGIPIFWTALTGAFGYAALLTSRVVPVFQFGAVLAGCTLAAAVLTYKLAPSAMLPPFSLEVPVKSDPGERVAGPLNHLIDWVADHPMKVVLGVLAVVLPVAAGMTRLEYESNYINAFKPTTRVVADYRETERRLGGIGVISLVLPASERIDMDLVKSLGELGRTIEGLQSGGRPTFTLSTSLATVLDPQGILAALPPDQARTALETKLALISASPQGALLDSFWSPRTADAPGSGSTRMVVRIEERRPVPEKEAAFRAVLAEVAKVQAFSDAARPAFVTGLSYLLTQTTRGVIESSWSTFLTSAAGILLMLTLAFRGLRLAALAILPTLLAVALVLGLTGWSGVKLDLATALVASVALGLSVDDTFHCLLQFQKRRKSAPFRESLLSSYHITGPGVLLSSLAVSAGFVVLRFGEFVPFTNFGTMVAVATLGSSLGNLLLLPACLALGHRLSEHRIASAPAAATGEKA